MEFNETVLHSFTIRIWLEEIAGATEAPKWRGHITHIPTNQRRHFEDLDDIKRFIKPYLRTPKIDPV